jgi:plastocyanin
MRPILLSLGLLAALAAAAIAQPAPPAPPSPAPAQASAPSPAPSPAAVVHIANFAFVPQALTVHPGATVLFINDDAVAHTVTARDRSFDSGDLASGASWSHTFATVGTYAYLCKYHTFMIGSVTVAAP